MTEAKLTDISGVGPAMARALNAHGFADVASVAGASAEDLARVPGFGAVRAAATIEAARALIGVSPTAATDSPTRAAQAESASKSKSKSKSREKGKGKGKKKKKDKKDKGKGKKSKKGKKGKKKDGKKKRKK